MASSTKITEIIDEKAFSDWERFIDSLQKGQSEMAKMVTETNTLNKALGGGTSIKTFSDDVTKLSKSLEEVAKQREKTIAAEAKAQISVGRAAQIAQKAAAKEQEKANNQAAAASQVTERLANAVDITSNAYRGQNRTLQEAVKNVLELKLELEAMKKEQKAAGDALKPEQLAAYAQRMELLKAAIQQGNTEVRQFARENVSAKDALQQMEAQLARMRGQFAALSKEERESSESARELALSITELDTEVKDLRKSMGQHQAEVGNYALIWDKIPEPIRNVVDALNKLGVEQKASNASTVQSIGFQRRAATSNDENRTSINDVTNALERSTTATQANATSQRAAIGFTIASTQAATENAEATTAAAAATEAVNAAEQRVTFSNMIAGLKAITLQAWAFIATPVGAAIAGIAAALGAAKLFFDYNKGLIEATRLTQTLTQTTGAEMRNIRDEISATAEVFGVDFNETLRAANVLSKEFGISFSEASDLINVGFVKGANASGQFLDNLREYSVQLRAAGLSATETISILTRTEKEGIFSDKGVDVIKEATLRIREMTKTTRTALEGIGIDADELQGRLLSGQTSVFEAIQEVGKKLNEFSDNSQEVGAVLADVFAGAGEDAGLRYLKIIGDINTEQEVSLGNLSDLEKALFLQIKATEELKKETASLFDVTGGTFELIIANVKLLATDLLIGLIQGIKNVYNGFVDVYNGSIVLRGGLELIVLVFKNMVTSSKFFITSILDGLGTLGKAIGAILKGEFGSLDGIFEAGREKSKQKAKDYGKEVGGNFADAYNNTLNNRLKKIEDFVPTATGGGGSSSAAGSGTVGDKAAAAAADKAADAAAKKAREDADKKRLKDKEDLEKRLLELAQLRADKEKRLIQEEADAYFEVYANEANAFEDRAANLNDYYDAKQRLIDADARLEMASIRRLRKEAAELQKEGKTEEYEALLKIIRLQQEAVKAEQIKATEELGEEIKKRSFELLRERYGDEKDWSLIALEEQYNAELDLLKAKRAKGLIDEEKYLKERRALSRKYNSDAINAQIVGLEAIIAAAKEKNLDVGELEKQLAKLKIEQSRKATDEQIADIEELEAEEKSAAERRKELYRDIAGATVDLFNTVFQNRIADVEQQQEQANTEKEIALERVENSTLSEEQKAAQKFAIESKFAAKERQLEAQRIKAQQRQARFNKAVAIAQIVQVTALGVARAFADYPFPASAVIAGLVGALGAIQLGTALATRVPTYFTGTNSSEEGWAHVGERGTELMVTPSGQAMLTPPRDTMAYLEAGTRIYNNRETKRILGGGDIAANPATLTGVERMVSEQRKSTSELKKTFKKYHSETNITKEGLSVVHGRNAKLRNYLNRNGIKL